MPYTKSLPFCSDHDVLNHITFCFSVQITCKNVHVYIEIYCVWAIIELAFLKSLSLYSWPSSSHPFEPLLHCTRWNMAMKARCVLGFFILMALSMYAMKGEKCYGIGTGKGHSLYLVHSDHQPICQWAIWDMYSIHCLSNDLPIPMLSPLSHILNTHTHIYI